jgi:uncharacterized protein YbaA (DUF1428 family)
MVYIDGFVLAVPKKNIAKYKKMATVAGKIWIKSGALAYYECVGDDIKAHGMRSFKDAAKCSKDEVPFFSFIIYKSKASRDAVNKKVMADDSLSKECGDIFNWKKMAYGGFKPLVEL